MPRPKKCHEPFGSLQNADLLDASRYAPAIVCEALAKKFVRP
jgi:hypothetical protein